MVPGPAPQFRVQQKPQIVSVTAIRCVCPEAGTKFLWLVEALDGPRSGVKQQYWLQLLTPKDVAAIEQATDPLRGLEVTAETQGWLLAEVYERNGLNQEAASVLEPLVREGEPPALVYRMLGDSYLRLGWLEEAEQTYQLAIIRAEAENAQRERGASAFGLARVAAARQDLDGAERWLQQAKAYYESALLPEQAKVMENLSGKVPLFRNQP